MGSLRRGFVPNLTNPLDPFAIKLYNTLNNSKFPKGRHKMDEKIIIPGAEAAPEKKKKILSCIQPSGIPTLGNYLGALKNWKLLSDEFDSAFAVADLHAITVRQDPKKLRQQITEVFALLLAIGLDPEKSIIFLQSQVPQHAQLGWILNCYTQFGEMSRTF